jgi:hypothetical protein
MKDNHYVDNKRLYTEMIKYVREYSDAMENLIEYQKEVVSHNIEIIKDGQVFARTSIENLVKDLPPPELMDFIIYTGRLYPPVSIVTDKDWVQSGNL